jgi:hypothetical protein
MAGIADWDRNSNRNIKDRNTKWQKRCHDDVLYQYPYRPRNQVSNIQTATQICMPLRRNGQLWIGAISEGQKQIILTGHP